MEQGSNHCHPVNNIGDGGDIVIEDHVCIIPKDGHVCYRTSWGSSGSDPNLNKTTWKVVQEISRRYKKMGATVEIIADGTKLLRMAQEVANMTANPYGNVVSGGRLSIDKVDEKKAYYSKRGYEIIATIYSNSSPNDCRIVLSNTRLTRERQLQKAKEEVERLEEMLK